MNRISVLFLLVDLCFSYLFIHEIGKLRVMCGIPLSSVHMSNLFQQFRNGILKNCQNMTVCIFSAIIDKCSNPNLF